MSHCYHQERRNTMTLRLSFMCTLSILALLITSCKNDGGTSTGNTDISGTYSYKGFDTTNTEVSSGTLVLRQTNSELNGDKNITGSIEAGTGTIQGRVVKSDTINLFLNPQQVGSVELQGAKGDETIHGDRRLNTGASPISRKIGTFRAIRVRR